MFKTFVKFEKLKKYGSFDMTLEYFIRLFMSSPCEVWFCVELPVLKHLVWQRLLFLLRDIFQANAFLARFVSLNRVICSRWIVVYITRRGLILRKIRIKTVFQTMTDPFLEVRTLGFLFQGHLKPKDTVARCLIDVFADNFAQLVILFVTSSSVFKSWLLNFISFISSGFINWGNLFEI